MDFKFFLLGVSFIIISFLIVKNKNWLKEKIIRKNASSHSESHQKHNDDSHHDNQHSGGPSKIEKFAADMLTIVAILLVAWLAIVVLHRILIFCQNDLPSFFNL